MLNVFEKVIANLKPIEAITFCTFAYLILFLMSVFSIVLVRRITH